MTDQLPPSLSRLAEIVRLLRAPNGCPWDQKQTPESFKHYLLEETHELLQAINDNQPSHIREELGDLIFQVVFLARLYEEQGHFTLDDALAAIIAKMIRRHPHVFGETVVEDEQALRRQWQAIKDQENAGKKMTVHHLEAIPKSLPALRRAQRVGDRVARRGFDWPDLAQAFAKVEEEFDELKKAMHAQHQEAFAEEFGDLLFALAIAGRKAGIDSEDALADATEKFIRRYRRLEELIADDGRQVEECGLPVLLAAWTQAKAATTPDQKAIDRKEESC
ncbi:MAG: nucleoside triphosphate pyrophosphohydrolase [Thermodesulfobacteriota bacterium]